MKREKTCCSRPPWLCRPAGFAGGAQRPEAQQHPVRGRERERRVHQDLRLWLRQAAESGERPAHDALLHRQLRRPRGTSRFLYFFTILLYFLSSSCVVCRTLHHRFAILASFYLNFHFREVQNSFPCFVWCFCSYLTHLKQTLNKRKVKSLPSKCSSVRYPSAPGRQTFRGQKGAEHADEFTAFSCVNRLMFWHSCVFLTVSCCPLKTEQVFKNYRLFLLTSSTERSLNIYQLICWNMQTNLFTCGIITGAQHQPVYCFS